MGQGQAVAAFYDAAVELGMERRDHDVHALGFRRLTAILRFQTSNLGFMG